jgi:hypothetical protein
MGDGSLLLGVTRSLIPALISMGDESAMILEGLGALFSRY